jgi:hypothetical protein
MLFDFNRPPTLLDTKSLANTPRAGQSLLAPLPHLSSRPSTPVMKSSAINNNTSRPGSPTSSGYTVTQRVPVSACCAKSQLDVARLTKETEQLKTENEILRIKLRRLENDQKQLSVGKGNISEPGMLVKELSAKFGISADFKGIKPLPISSIKSRIASQLEESSLDGSDVPPVLVELSSAEEVLSKFSPTPSSYNFQEEHSSPQLTLSLFTELRNIRRPALPVLKVLRALSLLLQTSESSILTDPFVLAKIKSFDGKQIDPETWARVSEIFEDLSVEKVKMISNPSGVIMEWILKFMPSKKRVSYFRE